MPRLVQTGWQPLEEGAARATSPLYRTVTPLQHVARAAHPPPCRGPRSDGQPRVCTLTAWPGGTVAAITGQRAAPADPARDEGRPGPGPGASPIPDHGVSTLRPSAPAKSPFTSALPDVHAARRRGEVGRSCPAGTHQPATPAVAAVVYVLLIVVAVNLERRRPGWPFGTGACVVWRWREGGRTRPAPAPRNTATGAGRSAAPGVLARDRPPYRDPHAPAWCVPAGTWQAASPPAHIGLLPKLLLTSAWIIRGQRSWLHRRVGWRLKQGGPVSSHRVAPA